MTCFADISAAAKKELWASLALRHAHGIGARRAKRLTEHFGSALAAVEAGLSSPTAWPSLKLIPRQEALDFNAGTWRAKATDEWAAIQKHGASFLLWTDERYPDALRQIPDAPLLLYYKGDLSLLRGPALAVVGARTCTHEGLAVSAFFARNLSKAGVTVVSGLARGIDRVAHLAGMEGPGRSVAVLGTGIDVCYPPEHRDLYDLLGARGLLLSEFAPGANALAAHFPVRNRLISGLSQGVLVVEAAARSGSLITARLALEQNRDVFAVPGHTMAGMSAGCRELIRLGAKPVFNADDILRDLAPLLALEAQKALEKRQREQAREAQARNPANNDHLAERDSAELVLPQGILPWVIPLPPGKSDGRRKKADAPAPLPVEPASLPADPAAPHQENSRDASSVLFDPPPDSALVSRPDAGPPSASLSPEETRIMAGLAAGQAHIDALALDLDMNVSQLSGLLTMLEVRGLVRRAPGMLYSLP